MGVLFDIQDLCLIYILSIAGLIEDMFSEEGLSCLIMLIYSLDILLVLFKILDPGQASQIILLFE